MVGRLTGMEGARKPRKRTGRPERRPSFGYLKPSREESVPAKAQCTFTYIKVNNALTNEN
jgi:hypothetical protein